MDYQPITVYLVGEHACIHSNKLNPALLLLGLRLYSFPYSKIVSAALWIGFKNSWLNFYCHLGEHLVVRWMFCEYGPRSKVTWPQFVYLSCMLNFYFPLSFLQRHWIHTSSSRFLTPSPHGKRRRSACPPKVSVWLLLLSWQSSSPSSWSSPCLTPSSVGSLLSWRPPSSTICPSASWSGFSFNNIMSWGCVIYNVILQIRIGVSPCFELSVEDVACYNLKYRATFHGFCIVN